MARLWGKHAFGRTVTGGGCGVGVDETHSVFWERPYRMRSCAYLVGLERNLHSHLSGDVLSLERLEPACAFGFTQM